MRRARSAVTAALVAILTAVSAAPAQAAPAGQVVVPVLRTGCDGFLYPDTTGAAAGADGRLHGFAGYRYSTTCTDRLYYVEGAGSSWTSTATPLRGTVVDVAQDATGTYLLYVIHELAETAELAVARRAPDGTLTRLAVVAPVAGDMHGQGSIVVRGGRWLAVWSQPGSTPGDDDLYRYGTLYPSATVQPVAVGAGRDTSPALTFAPDGAVILAFTRGAPATKAVRVARTTDGTSWSSRTAASGVPINADFPGLDVAVTSAGTVVSWTESTAGISRVVVADDLAGSWRRQQPPAAYDSASWDATILAAGRKVFAGYGSGDEYPTDALVFAQRSTPASAWTEVPADAGPGSIDSRGVVALGRTGNTVTALVVSGAALYAVTGLPF